MSRANFLLSVDIMSYNNIITFLQHPDHKIWDSASIEKLEEIKKNKRTWGWGVAFLSYNALKRGSQFLFSRRQVSRQKRLCQIGANVGMKRFHIVKYSYAASFSIKTSFSSTKKTKKRDKTKASFWKYIKNKGKVTSDISVVICI